MKKVVSGQKKQLLSNAKKDEELEAGMKIYEDLKSAGIETIIDDRKKERFGFKMGDYELLGFPYAIIVGKKLQDGLVEIANRKTGQKTDVAIDEVVQKIEELLK
jgi:prolyl-tRNA synthetase